MDVNSNKSLASSLLLMSLLLWTAVAFVNGSSVCCADCIQCPGRGKCIQLSSICDGRPDCEYGEEESEIWCQKYKHSSCPLGQTICRSRNCATWSSSCANGYNYCNGGRGPNIDIISFEEVCPAMNSRLLPDDLIVVTSDTASLETGLQISMEELATFVSAANCSLAPTNGTGQASSCPMLYRPLGGMCLAVLPFELTWPEAREACHSIAGELAEFGDADSFAELVQHLVKIGFSSNFWTGGFFDIKKEAWCWSSGPDMPSATPFWMLRHSVACTARASPTFGALPGCFRYSQAPAKLEVGYCAALQFEYMYYISDEGCYDKKKPLCFHDLAITTTTKNRVDEYWRAEKRNRVTNE